MKGKEHSIVLVVVTIICAVLVALVFVEEPTDDIYYMGSKVEGAFFLQPSSEYENMIFVTNEDLDAMDFEVEDLNVGDKLEGTFTDRTLWELESIKQE